MRDRYLSFRTPESGITPEGLDIGTLILRRLGDGFESLNFTVDYEAGREEPDWVFLARRGEALVGLALCLLNRTQSRWFITLYDERLQNLESTELRRELHPMLQATISGWPGVSELWWHEHHSTLRQAGRRAN